MPTQTLKLAGKEYVLVPKREFTALTRRANTAGPGPSRRMSARDKGDVAEAKRLAARNEKSISLSELRRELGL